jgi:mono/diheme cytochrome c family protein
MRKIEGHLLVACAALLAAAALSCGGSEEAPTGGSAAPAPAPAAPAPAATGPSEVAVNQARQIFELRCVTCHGEKGAGDGPGSASLDPKPRNFSDTAWQDSVSDEHLSAIILMGGAAVGMSPTMPSNPDLQAKPAVVQALIAQIRELRAR